ncbi:MAG: FMN-binding negative transcriptional regulator [Candidatus Eremiobacteraeota bacterium]|nr:FMN-binding negative transcriptional regulator [Candidatus Eremiobacteraeota bacterium]
MYTPADFKQEDRAAALEVIEKEPFGTLITTQDGLPAVTHLPFSIVTNADKVVLCAHMAAANPQWRTLSGSRALAIFRGPHGYVSPRWYADPAHDVPTWNYIAVHCTGVARIAPEEDKAPILSRLVSEMESGAAQPWTVASMEQSYFERLKGGIVAFYLDVEKIEAKFKLSQNRAPEDRNGAIDGLRASGDPQDRRLASEMERYAPTPYAGCRSPREAG